ncbi:MAG: N-methyl-L-tryptophan oxidase [Planctomycetales bacterium]|nr:N-methyl-L-tryptophan oxidase [Planctomycetales bacterium]
MANWDAIVIGLGGAGSAAAYHLARSGCRVLGIDQYPAVHPFGSSHGKTRIIRQAYFEDVAYVPLLRRAYELWNQLEQSSEQKLYHRTGLIELGPANGVVIPGVLRSAAEHGLEVQQLSIAEVQRRWPGIVGREDWLAVIEQNAGYLNVEACVRSHLQQAELASATLRHAQAVRSWRVDGNAVTVTTDHGVECAGRLVIAGGPWSASLLGPIGVPLQVLRKHQYWYSPEQSGYRQSDGFPCFFHETPNGYYYGFPSIDDAGVKVARHSGGTKIAGPTLEGGVDDEDRSLVERFVDNYLPGVGSRLTAQLGCYYTVTKDENFIVDLHPDHEQVVIVAGLSGHGFKFTSVLGELASQLAIDGSTTLETSFLGIGRFKS